MAKNRRHKQSRHTGRAHTGPQSAAVPSGTGGGPGGVSGGAFWKPAPVSTPTRILPVRPVAPGRTAAAPQLTLPVRVAASAHTTRPPTTARLGKDRGSTDGQRAAPSEPSAPGPNRPRSLRAIPEPDHPHSSTTASGDPSVTDTMTIRRTPWLARRSGSSAASVTSVSCGPARDMQPQSLGFTYWFDTEPNGDPYSVNLYLQGRRRSSEGTEAAHFSTVTTVETVVPGSGPISVTTRITDAQPGIWDITATPVRRVAEESTAEWEVMPDPLMPIASTRGATLFAAFNRALAPGVHIGAWPAMVSLGAVLGLALQSALAGRLGLSPPLVAVLTVVACLLGVLGAKAYYLVTHPEERGRVLTSGMSVQGFVVTVVLVLLLGGWALPIPVGTLFDVSAPGLLLGMAVGRLGCLLGGCCAGRPTPSRWGIWSSDRRIGARRIPVQLLESSTALLICAATIAAVAAFGVSGGGLVFLSAVAANIAARQVLFPLRDLPRATLHGRELTLAISLAVALVAVGGLFLNRL